ncbi:hypothetical protein C0W66_05480 [Photobacterium kishitanii]|nr:hypothetical protein AYY23_03785 [Photobacterium kishitanii]PSW50345.1 hypothetical protein C0W66_05480 [Photobacterium kishitanii]
MSVILITIHIIIARNILSRDFFSQKKIIESNRIKNHLIRFDILHIDKFKLVKAMRSSVIQPVEDDLIYTN